MAFSFAGRRLERRHRSNAYSKGRLPESERTPTERWATLGNGGRLCHNSVLEVVKGGKDAAKQRERATIVAEHRKIINQLLKEKQMFNITIPAAEATISRGRTAKDISTDPLFLELKALPIVASDGDWLTDGVSRNEKESRAFMALVYKLAKAGAGTIRCRYQKKTGHVLLQRLAAEWRPLRNSGE